MRRKLRRGHGDAGTRGRFACPTESGTGETSPCPREKRPHVPVAFFIIYETFGNFNRLLLEEWNSR